MSRTASICLLLLAATTLPARAAAPVFDRSTAISDNEVVANCGDFLLVFDGVASISWTTFLDNGGVPQRVTLHGVSNGMLSNPITGKALADEPSVMNMTLDLEAGTTTQAGAWWTVTVPGEGSILIEAGRLVFDGSGPPVFIAGPHLPPPETIATLCAALR